MADIPMEEGTEQIVTGGGSSGSVSISIHPLVVMNVSDHFTRVKVQNDTNIRGLCIHFKNITLVPFLLFSIWCSFGSSERTQC